MTDRELLEYAAKAAEIELIPMEVKNVTKRGDDRFIGYMTNPDQWQKGWFNPLTDDGDALRLAVKLRLDVEWLDHETVFVFSAQHVANKDPYATTRRAIVRAAAEMGKHKEKNA